MLRDRFRPPLSRRRPWHSIHHVWATALAAELNEQLPVGWFAAPNVQFGIEVGVATFEDPDDVSVQSEDGAVLRYAPPPPLMTLEFPLETDVVEIEIFTDDEEVKLVAAVELVSPANKDRPEHRRAFLNKCEHLLRRAIGVAVVDVVTSRRANLHSALLRRFGVERVTDAGELYAASYRPFATGDKSQLDVWESTLRVAESLPTIPLALLDGPIVPLNLGPAYERACRELRVE